MALLALLVVAAFANVVFDGRSLVPSENLNPLDSRPQARVRGPDFVPDDEWTRRNLVAYPNFRDIRGASAFAFSGTVIQTAPSELGQRVAFFSLPLLVTEAVHGRV